MGVILFVAIEHMVDASQNLGWGWDVITFVALLNIWLMVCHAWGGVGCDHIRFT